MPLDAVTATLITTATLMAVALLRRWLRSSPRLLRRRSTSAAGGDRWDTVADWPPEPAKVMAVAELQALALARSAAPQALLLGQVPLWRFLRVPARHPYALWLARAGHLNADVLVCDDAAQVLAVIDVHAEGMSERSKRRHSRLRRVLKTAGIPVLVWQQGRLPSLVKARAQFSALGVPMAGAHTAQVRVAPHPTSEDAEAFAAASSRRKPVDALPSDFYGLHTSPSSLM
jgi:hypothetical protein